MKPSRRSSGARPSAALDVLVVGVGAGQPFARQSPGHGPRSGCSARPPRSTGSARSPGILGCCGSILAATAISSGARSGRARSCSSAASGASGWRSQQRLGEHLAQARARRPPDHDEAPGPQLAVVGRAGARGQDPLQRRLVGPRLAEERRRRPTAASELLRAPPSARPRRAGAARVSAARPRAKTSPRRPSEALLMVAQAEPRMLDQHVWCCAAASAEPCFSWLVSSM